MMMIMTTMMVMAVKVVVAILVTGRETSRLPYFPENRLIDGDEVVSFTRRPPFTPSKIPVCSFLLEAESTPPRAIHSAVGRIRSLEKSKDLIGKRTRDLPACSIVNKK
jgi:hypothetical protein